MSKKTKKVRSPDDNFHIMLSRKGAKHRRPAEKRAKDKLRREMWA